VRQFLILTIAVAIIGIAVVLWQDLSAIGDLYRDRSLYVYLFKSGEVDPYSAEAIAHVEGLREYGILVGVRLIVSALAIGIVLGFLMARRLYRLNN
jgi:hypothetical protein